MSTDISFSQPVYAQIRENEKLLETIRKKITSQFRSYNPEDVKDAFNEAILKLEVFCQSLQKWNWPHLFVEGFLFLTTRNNLVNYYRKQLKSREVEEIYLTFESDQPSFRSLEEFKGLIAEKFIEHHLENYPRTKRDIIKAFLTGTPIKEIEQNFNIQSTTVRKYVIMFRKEIKDILNLINPIL